MTESLEMFKKNASEHEHYLAEELREQKCNFERCTDHQKGQQCKECSGEGEHEQESGESAEGGNGERQVYTSAPPTIYAYGREKAILNSSGGGKHAEESIQRILNEQQELVLPNLAQEAPVQKQTHEEYFKPTKQFIYTPQSGHAKPINQTKAMLGQTTFIPSLHENTETVWRNNFLQTQTMNDEEGKCAEDGLEPICNKFEVEGAEGETFTVNYKGKIREMTDNGYIKRGINRESLEEEPKDQYLELIKSQKFEKAPGMRPYEEGAPFARTVRSEDLENLKEVKELKFDTRTTEREEYGDINQDIQIIAYKEQVRAHQRWLADKSKGSPVGNGFPAEMMTTNEYYSSTVVEFEKQQEYDEKERLKSKCVDEAVKLFGGDMNEARDWVESLPLEKQKELAFLGEEAERREKNPLFNDTIQ